MLKKHLSEPWFSLVSLNKKKYEGRLNKGDFRDIKVNDIIEFYNDDFEIKRSCKMKVIKIRYFNSFKEMLRKCTLKKCLPTVITLEDGIKIYKKYYSEEQEKEFGIIAMKLTKLID